MSIFRVPRDPPPELSNHEVILDNPTYETGSFEGFVMADTNYFAWFLQSSARPIIDDCPMSGGRVLKGIARARRVSEVHLSLQVYTLQARDGYVQEEIARSLAQDKDQWKREGEAYVVAIKKEKEVAPN